MKVYEASTAIDAAPEVVWEILMDTAAYPEWDPYAIRIEGSIAPGSKLRAFSTLSPNRAFPATVTELVPNRAMTWTGGMPFGLFTGERTFRLEPAGAGTRFRVREEFRGPMLALIGRTLPDMTEPFAAFVAGLKERAEARA